MFGKKYLLFSILAALFIPRSLGAHEFSGEIGFEFRAFTDAPLDSRQHNGNFSVYAQPEYYHSWDNRKQSVTIEPFLRLDQNDEERTHFDIRELYWEKASNAWELRVGIRKVFWGVVESQHLVDIINQTDLVENIDTEDKLGQPMINLALIQKWGTLDLFILPGFRERTFPGVEGRLRTPLVVDTDNPIYDSGDEERHIDVAARWSHYIGDFDFGVAHFSGTSREPLLVPRINARGVPFFVPRYDIIDQTSLDLQATKGSWLWKLEALTRSGQGRRFNAASGGFEYTFVGIFGRAYDLGVLAEYHIDDRDNKATTPFQDDLFTGARLVLNDAQSTEVLGGIVTDRKRGIGSLFVEASRRLGDALKLSLEGRAFFENSTADPLSALRRDDHLQLDLTYFF